MTFVLIVAHEVQCLVIEIPSHQHRNKFVLEDNITIASYKQHCC